MVNYEITKKSKIYETNDCYVHNYYYLIYGRMLNEEKTRQRKFKYIEWFDIFDVMEYFDKDIVTDNDIKEYINILTENTYLENIKDFNDTKNIEKFYEFCNETINDYNNLKFKNII